MVICAYYWLTGSAQTGARVSDNSGYGVPANSKCRAREGQGHKLVTELEYWKKTIGLYVRRLRKKADMGQKELAIRSTVSLLENAKSNPTLETLLQVFDGIGGDISDAFQSYVPKELHTEHRHLHEMMQRILATGDPDAIRDVTRYCKYAFHQYVESPEESSPPDQ